MRRTPALRAVLSALALGAWACHGSSNNHPDGGSGGMVDGGPGDSGAPDGGTNDVILDVGGQKLLLGACGPNIVRVAYAPSADFFKRSSLTTAARQCSPTTW